MSRAAFLEATDELIGTGEQLVAEPEWDRFRLWLLESDRLLERVWGRMDRYHLAWLNVGRDSAPPGSALDEEGTRRFIVEVAGAKLAVLRTMRTSVERQGWTFLSDDPEQEPDQGGPVSYEIAPGGLAAVLAHPDDESVGCAGALALAHDAGATTRLLVATRGEAGTPDGAPDPAFGGIRESELICAAQGDRPRRGLDPRRLHRWRVADEPFERLVTEIAAWLADRRPQAVITFGAHGVTGHPDHIVVGNATRWAVERLADVGQAPNSVYVISPVFDPAGSRYDLSPEEQIATHRIEITSVAGAQARRPRMPRQPDRHGRGDRGAACRDRGGRADLRGLLPRASARAAAAPGLRHRPPLSPRAPRRSADGWGP